MSVDTFLTSIVIHTEHNNLLIHFCLVHNTYLLCLFTLFWAICLPIIRGKL